MDNYININKLMMYRKFVHQDLFEDFVWLINNIETPNVRKDEKIEILYTCINELLEIANNYGFEGNLYHNFLGFILANNENAFSTSAEIIGPSEGTINNIALHDFEIFKALMDYDLSIIDKTLDVDVIELISDYKNGGRTNKVFNKRVRDRICELTKLLEGAKNVKEYYDYVTDFYKAYGVGKFGLNKAFRLICNEGEDTKIIPVTSIEHVVMRGYRYF